MKCPSGGWPLGLCATGGRRTPRQCGCPSPGLPIEPGLSLSAPALAGLFAYFLAELKAHVAAARERWPPKSSSLVSVARATPLEEVAKVRPARPCRLAPPPRAAWPPPRCSARRAARPCRAAPPPPRAAWPPRAAPPAVPPGRAAPPPRPPCRSAPPPADPPRPDPTRHAGATLGEVRDRDPPPRAAAATRRRDPPPRRALWGLYRPRRPNRALTPVTVLNCSNTHIPDDSIFQGWKR